MPGLIELFLADFELLMGLFHIHSMVIAWASCDHRDEGLLTIALLFHVRLFEERRSDGVRQHVFVELIHNRADSRLPSQSLKQILLYIDTFSDSFDLVFN